MAAPIALAAALVMASVAAARAVELEPGTWKEIETGTENGKPVLPATGTTCMSEEDAKNPLKGLSPEKSLKELKERQDFKCKTADVKQSDQGFSMRLQCGDPKQFAMDFAVNYTFTDPHSYSGTVKSVTTILGQTTTSDKTIEGRWMSGICIRRRAAEPRG